jgi:RND family efflux transporter MFP subunit
MKKIIYILGISFLLINCSQEIADTSNTNRVEGINLEELNTQKANYTQQINDLKLELEKINSAIDALGSSEKRTLITAFITETQSFEHQIEIQANIKTRQNVLIYPEFAGRLITLKVVEGQNVKKGNLLALIDDAGITDQLDQMILQLNLAKTTFERTQRLWDQKIGSEMMYLEAKTRYKAAQKQVSQIKQQLAKTKIYAPFNGTIDQIFSNEGANVAPGITPILRIVNLNKMYVEADVPENYLTSITKGSKARVQIPVLGKSQSTLIRQIGNYIRPSNRTFRVEASLENPNKEIKPNLNAKLSIIDYINPEAIMVPRRAVRSNSQGQNYVFILSNPEGENKFIASKQFVQLGKTKNEMIEIIKGVSKGDLLIDEGVSLLEPNQKVKRIEL